MACKGRGSKTSTNTGILSASEREASGRPPRKHAAGASLRGLRVRQAKLQISLYLCIHLRAILFPELPQNFEACSINQAQALLPRTAGSRRFSPSEACSCKPSPAGDPPWHASNAASRSPAAENVPARFMTQETSGHVPGSVLHPRHRGLSCIPELAKHSGIPRRATDRVQEEFENFLNPLLYYSPDCRLGRNPVLKPYEVQHTTAPLGLL